MKLRVLIILIALATLLGLVLTNHPPAKNYRITVVDVSWPNCNTKYADVFAKGIVGVNGGLDFHPNPCLGREATWFSRYAVYMNTGYPGDARGRKFINVPRRCGFYDSSCLAYNYGFNAAAYSIQYANSQNVHANAWWLDVETENSWTNNFLVNRQFLNGAIAAIKQKVWFSTVGIYSSSDQWQEITGPWHNKLPAWLATGSFSKTVAAQACRDKPFTGGNIQLTQYTAGIDKDFTCLPTDSRI